jgi:hypothetical protein
VRLFENRMLRRVFGIMRDEVRGVWRKKSMGYCVVVLFTKYYGMMETKRIRLEGHSGCMGMRIMFKIVVGKFVEKK